MGTLGRAPLQPPQGAFQAPCHSEIVLGHARFPASCALNVNSWWTNSIRNCPLIIRRRLATLNRIRAASCVGGVTWGRLLSLRTHRRPFCFNEFAPLSGSSYFRIGGQVSVPLGH